MASNHTWTLQSRRRLFWLIGADSENIKRVAPRNDKEIELQLDLASYFYNDKNICRQSIIQLPLLRYISRVEEL